MFKSLLAGSALLGIQGMDFGATPSYMATTGAYSTGRSFADVITRRHLPNHSKGRRVVKKDVVNTHRRNRLSHHGACVSLPLRKAWDLRSLRWDRNRISIHGVWCDLYDSSSGYSKCRFSLFAY